jgi:hypothetical protein
MVVDATDTAEAPFAPTQTVYNRDQLLEVLGAFGLTNKAIEAGIKEVDETGNTTFHW